MASKNQRVTAAERRRAVSHRIEQEAEERRLQLQHEHASPRTRARMAALAKELTVPHVISVCMYVCMIGVESS